MYTPQEIALEIEQIKPDFSKFIKLLQNHKSEQLLTDIQNTENMSEKLFKAQLTIITYETHNKFYAYGTTHTQVCKLIFENISNSGIYQRQSYYYTTGYYIKDNFFDKHIAYYIKDIKPYLTPYLWNKVRTKKAPATDFKELKPDEFALVTFKKHLENLKKKLPSTQIKIYVQQIKNFPMDLKQKYLDILLGHVGTPSLDLQKELKYTIPDIKSTDVKKFMWLGNKWSISNLATCNAIPVPNSVYDDRVFDYKPFVTNVKRKPTTDLPNLSFLVGTSVLLKTLSKKEPNLVYDYFAQCIDEHLKNPEYEVPLKEYLKTLKINSEVLGEYCDKF